MIIFNPAAALRTSGLKDPKDSWTGEIKSEDVYPFLKIGFGKSS